MRLFLSLIIMFELFFMLGCNKKSKELVIQIPLVTWGGYAALFAANNGSEPKEDSLFYKYGKFKVKLVQEENPANHLQGFANGTYQIIWSTMDMLPLHYETLSKDSRTIPVVIGLFDYSAGGDGVITRGKYNSVKEFRGKKVVAAQFTPSHYFLLWLLDQENMTQKDINAVLVSDAIIAKDTYINDKTIDVCITWSPFIYDITDPKKETYVKDSYLFTTTAKGNPAYGLIADVYLARSDLVKERPDVIYAFTKAMIDGYEIFLTNQDKVASDIASFFGIKGGAEEVKQMFADVTIAGKEENKQFFHKNNKFSAYNIFKISTELYKKNGNIIKESFNVDPENVIASKFMLEVLK